MNTKIIKTLGYIVIGGLLVKIIQNQKVIDYHIYNSRHGYGIDYEDTLERNTLMVKMYNIISKKSSK